MCTTIRREYRLDHLRPDGVAGFAGAALLNTLPPLDWQITQDVEAVVRHSAEALLECLLSGGVPAPPETGVWVEVTVHRTFVEVVAGTDDPRWVTERVRLRPRRPFSTDIDCPRETSGDEGDEPPPTARPELWPALARPRAESSWIDTYAALSAVTQSIRDGVGDLAATLDAVARGVVRATSFTVAVVNLARADGGYEVVSVSGPPSVRDLLGVVEDARHWDALIAASRRWGTLCYLAGEHAPPDMAHMTTWVPSIETAPGDPDAWQPLDMIFAELLSRTGERLGVLSVDLPGDGARPDVDALERLELFADHAATAIERARAGRLH